MKELIEIRVNDNRILLSDNLVKSAILPKVVSELDRDVVIQGNCVIEGAVYAKNLEIQQGPVEIQGAIFTQVELHISNDAKGRVLFNKSVGSADSVASFAPQCRVIFMADINAKQVRLRNAFIAGSIFADDIILEDCIVCGGVFASRDLDINNCIIGTFNSPSVKVAKIIHLLLPSAFSVEKINALPGSEIYNLTLADLGSIFKGMPQLPNTGKIKIDFQKDEQKTVLTSDDSQQVLRCYSVAGKVLIADLLDYEKMQNHFLIGAASLGSQLLKTYDLGIDSKGKTIELTIDNISDFFFEVLHGKKIIQNLEGNFLLKEMTDKLN